MEYDQVIREINLIFDYRPPYLSPDPSSQPAQAARPSFYDKHVDERLALKRVIILPSLLSSIGSTVDKALNSLIERKIFLPTSGGLRILSTQESRKSVHYERPIIDAESVAQAYMCTTAKFCHPIASMLLLSPSAPKWGSMLTWNVNPLGPRLDDYEVITEDYGLRIRNLSGAYCASEDIQNAVSRETHATLVHAHQEFPMLAVWEFFPISPDIEAVIRRMEKTSEKTFTHARCTAAGYTSCISVLDPMPDAATTAWGISPSFCEGTSSPAKGKYSSGSHISQNTVVSGSPQLTNSKNNIDQIVKRPQEANLHINSGINTVKESQWPSITIPEPRVRKDDDIAASILQRAWSRAVHRDATFIIFNCGNFERIAFRYRATQTLYLSELIDISRCKDPGYGKLHIGLYLCILHDVLDRTTQLRNFAADNQPKGRKRRRATDVAVENGQKRPRTRAVVAKEKAIELDHRGTCELLLNEDTARDVVFIRMRHGKYNSPAPATFLRSGRPRPKGTPTYGPHEYISVVITSDIASGATGCVHGAKLELFMPHGKVRDLSVAVKFAFGDQERERMRHEFAIYQHLASFKVDGIPTALGLFDDMESDTLALIMTHVGTSLVERPPYEIQVTVTDSERSAFIRVMKQIHRAGVRHRDIRPENLMIGNAGKVYIIDFDKAELNPSDGAKRRELVHLKDLLNGHYLPPGEVSSVPTPNGIHSTTSTESEED